MIKILNHVNKLQFINLSKGYKIVNHLNGILSMKNMLNFSKLKKEKPQLKVPTINISKINEELSGFLLYQNQQGARIKTISIAFVFCFLFGYWTYRKIEDDEIKVNYMIMGAILTIPFIVFQFRTAATLKRLVLDKTGENVVLTRFQLGGFGQETTKARVQILKGIGKAYVFGGSVIKGGGTYGLEERSYWFQSKYIIDPIIFQEVVQGNRIKVDKTKIF